jgi:hypothetical protein
VYEQTLPAGPEAVESARAWIRAIASPELAESAALVIGDLVGSAIARAPAGGRIKIAATSEPDELSIEVRTPSKGPSHGDGPGWSECSRHAWSLETTETASTYTAGAKVRRPKQVAAVS